MKIVFLSMDPKGAVIRGMKIKNLFLKAEKGKRDD